MKPDPFARTPGQPRNAERIDIVLSALRAYWLANPDLRLGQMVVNAAGTADPFYVEDDQMSAMWREWAETHSTPMPAKARGEVTRG